MTRRRALTAYELLTPVTPIEGMRFVVTDFGAVRVKDKTAKWFLDHHASSRLKQSTVERRANDSLVATASFLVEREWRKGERLEEI